MEGEAASRGVGRMPGRSRQGREGKEPAAQEPCGTDHTPELPGRGGVLEGWQPEGPASTLERFT